MEGPVSLKMRRSPIGFLDSASSATSPLRACMIRCAADAPAPPRRQYSNGSPQPEKQQVAHRRETSYSREAANRWLGVTTRQLASSHLLPHHKPREVGKCLTLDLRAGSGGGWKVDTHHWPSRCCCCCLVAWFCTAGPKDPSAAMTRLAFDEGQLQ